MSDSFFDAGGHDHGGGHVHLGHGGDAGGFGGHAADSGHGHGGHGHHHHHTGEINPGPQGSISWTSALSTVKLTDALQGINVTPNFMLLLLFLGFAGWLFVVYWVRHNDPLHQQVLGNGAAHSATGHADRKIVEGIRQAYPLRTSEKMGLIYVPGAPPPNAQFGSPAGGHYPVAVQPAQALQHASPPHVASATAHAPAAPTTSFGHTPAFGVPVVSGQAPAYGAYHVPIQTPEGVRLKTVANR